MVIDFHTHIFPDKVAPKALSQLSATSGIIPYTDGTLSGLLSSMERGGVDIGVVLPVVTNPAQFDSILRFASFVNERQYEEKGPRLISFAGIHPDDPDYAEHLKQIKEAGFRGIKLHPHYYGIAFDDIRTLRILEEASSLGLIILTHAGYDPISPEHDFCTPDMILSALAQVSPEKLVLAHMGCNCNFEEALERLCGLPVWLDTGFSISQIDEETFVRMVRKHGAGRILFATDSPWTDQGEGVKKLRSFGSLTDEEKQQILYGNAASLLSL